MFKKHNKNNIEKPKIIIREGDDYIANQNIKHLNNKNSDVITEKENTVVKSEESISADKSDKTELVEKKSNRIINNAFLKRFHIKIIAIILFLSVLIIFLFMNRGTLLPNDVSYWIDTNLLGMPDGEGFPFELDNSKTNANNIVSYDGNIAVLGNTNFKLINSSGKEIYSFAHSYANPILESNDGLYFIYSSGEQYYSIIDGDDYTKYDASNPISDIAIADNGRYIISTQTGDYSSRISVYLADGTLKYTYDFAYGYVTAVSINDNGTEGAVSYVSSENGVLYSNVVIFDFNDTEPIYEYKSEDNLIVEAYFVDNSYYLIGDNDIVYIKNDEFYLFDYEGKALTAYTANDDKVVVSLSSYSGSFNCEVYVFEPDAEIYYVETSGSVSSISTYGATFSVLIDNMIYSYDLNGTNIGSVDISFDANSIALLNESRVYILAARQIILEKIE